jgi:site-specific DNA recombinase
VTRFAFYGRVSTEDQQDPESSRQWQLTRSKALIEPVGGAIVAEFFDVGLSRSLPWKRRPQAAALLEAFKDPARGYEAVVVGEPARAFYGNQFGLTFPVFVHYGVELWVPEVGGRVDPGSDAHDLVMAMYGGMSKGERNRIKIRVRTAMAAQASVEGRYLGGRPPYGYRLADAGPHPNPGKAAVGQRLHRLEPDPVTAPVVQRIFAEYVGGTGLRGIAERLNRDGVPCPSAHDRARNPHRSGDAWQESAVRAILINPRYTGHEVWNKQRKDEVLLDVDDVALGHETRMRWNPERSWIWSPDVVHEPVVSRETFDQSRAVMRTRQGPGVVRKPRSTPRPYILRSLLFCGVCGRRMEGAWVQGRPQYRCKLDPRRRVEPPPGHPRTIYVREDRILPPLDGWLGKIFGPERIDQTVEALHRTSEDPVLAARREAAREAIRHCDERLAKYRAALDAGVDPTVVGRWIREVEAERVRREIELRQASGQRMTREQIRSLVQQLGDIVAVLRDADPADKAVFYQELRLQLTYEPQQRLLSVEARPGQGCTKYGVRGGT